MVCARLEYCAKWQRMASAQESNNQIAIRGLCRPTEKNAARKLTGHTSQKKNCGAAIDKLRWPKEKHCGAAIGVLRQPKEKNHSTAIDGLRRPKEKITARQSMDCAGQKKKHCCVAIKVSCWPLQKNSSTAIRVSGLPLQKSWRGNQGITPASSKFAQGLGIASNGWCKA
jgi:hypothetical protein